jgi:hypothetical protein
MVSASARREPAWFRIPYRLARGGERVRRAGNVLYWKRRARSLPGCMKFSTKIYAGSVFEAEASKNLER